MNANKVIKTYWEGALSNLERLAIKSWIANGHTALVYTFDKKLASFDKDMIVMDASEILSLETRRKVRGISTVFSDIFRYCLLCKTGGWWFDLDTVLLKPITTESPIVMSMSFKEKINGKFDKLALNSNPLKVPRGHALAEAWLRNAEKRDITKEMHGDMSGSLVEKEALNLKLENYFVKPEIYSPLGWLEGYKAINPGLYFDRITTETVSIHFFNVMWSHGENTGKPLDKNKKYHPDSLYEFLKKKYEIV